MASLEVRRIERQLEGAPPSMPRLHPNLAELYCQKVANLAEALNEQGTRLDSSGPSDETAGTRRRLHQILTGVAECIMFSFIGDINGCVEAPRNSDR
jgi:hypothetical protein